MSIFRTRRSLKPAAMDAACEVPREVLLALLEDAHWAPTHGLTQPWRFQVFTGAARDRLAEGLQSLYDGVTSVEARDAAKRAKLAAAPRTAPVVIAVSAKVVPGGKIPEWEEVAAVACSIQNLLLSAHTRGLGGYWSTPPVACSPEFGAWLGLDAACHRQLGLVYLGWPRVGEPEPVSTRCALAERVMFHDA